MWRPQRRPRTEALAAGFRDHDVYIEPGCHEIYKQTNRFPEGTIMFKELQLTQPGENPDGSRTEPWGRGYFPGPANQATVHPNFFQKSWDFTSTKAQR